MKLFKTLLVMYNASEPGSPYQSTFFVAFNYTDYNGYCHQDGTVEEL